MFNKKPIYLMLTSRTSAIFDNGRALPAPFSRANASLSHVNITHNQIVDIIQKCSAKKPLAVMKYRLQCFIYILFRCAQPNIKYLYYTLCGNTKNKKHNWMVCEGSTSQLTKNGKKSGVGGIEHARTYQTYIPKFLETDNFASRLSDRHPSFAFSDTLK